MEKGHYQKGLIHRNVVPIGIDLGFYGCAEHHRGIVELSEKFGIRPGQGLSGYEARKITALPTGLHFAKSTDSSYLILERRLRLI